MEHLPTFDWDQVATKDDVKAVAVELRAEMQLGFARLERRLAWYLVAVAALVVGFGLAVWIPLASTLADVAEAAHSVPAPETGEEPLAISP